MSSDSEHDRNYWLWIGWIVLAVGAAGLLWLVSTSLKQAQVAAREAVYRANLRAIGKALLSYHEEYQSFPPAYVLGDDGRRWHSWRVLILPFLGDKSARLYEQYRFDEPWDGPNNRRLADRPPEVFTSPFKAEESGGTPWVAVVGSRTVWPGPFAIRLRDIRDGTSNTLMLIENPDSKINWLEPRDFTYRDAHKLFRKRMRLKVPDREKELLALGADAVVRPIVPRASFGSGFLGLLTPSGGPSRLTSEQIAEHFPEEAEEFEGDLVRHQFGPARRAGELQATRITPHLSASTGGRENVVYCATFQLAWDECRTTECGGQPIQLSGNPPLADELNRHPFPRKSLSAECYFASGGSNGQITAAMQQHFPRVTLNLTPPPDQPYLTFFSYLEKDLPFAEDFERLEKPISFQARKGKQQVAGFGLEPSVTNAKTGDPILQEQIRLLHYANPDDFVVRLTTNGPQKDEIVLAKIPPGETLQATLQQARNRIEKKSVPYNRFALETVDTLAVPVMELNVEKSYAELMGRRVTNVDARIHRWSVSAARQLIRLRIDETGGALISAAEFQVVASMDEKPKPPPRAPRKLVFDEPFLVFLQEPGAAEPYFVTWMANAELMETNEF